MSCLAIIRMGMRLENSSRRDGTLREWVGTSNLVYTNLRVAFRIAILVIAENQYRAWSCQYLSFSNPVSRSVSSTAVAMSRRKIDCQLRPLGCISPLSSISSPVLPSLQLTAPKRWSWWLCLQVPVMTFQKSLFLVSWVFKDSNYDTHASRGCSKSSTL